MKILCRNSVLLFNLWLVGAAIFFVPPSVADNARPQIKTPPKILYINSYHPDFFWSESVKNQFVSSFDTTEATIKVVYMDTKRHNAVEDIIIAAENIMTIAKDFSPDIIVAADDNASKYVIEPYFKESKTPVVFVGVDIDEKMYGYPYSNATGIVEQPGSGSLISALQRAGQKTNDIGVILGNTTTARKKVDYYNAQSINVRLVNDFEQWQEAYLSLQSTMDVVLLDSYAGLSGFSEQKAFNFILHNTRVLVVSVSNPSKNLCHLCYIDLPKRHGHWVAITIKKILAGASPSTIAIERNNHFKLIINKTLLEKTNIIIPEMFYQLPHEEI